MNYEDIIERLLDEKHITVKEAIYLLQLCNKLSSQRSNEFHSVWQCPLSDPNDLPEHYYHSHTEEHIDCVSHSKSIEYNW